MGLFSKKEDTRYVKEFDSSMNNISRLGQTFKDIHFESMELFDNNFRKEKSPKDLERERVLFEKHLDVLQKLKHETDVMLDEALKLVRNETALSERDREALRDMMSKPAPTTLKVRKKKK